MENEKKEDRNSFNIDVNKLMKTMSEIFSDLYGCQITMTARLKEDAK